MIQDRVVSGAIAGIMGALGQNIYALIMVALGFNGPAYIDYGKIILLYKIYPGLLATILGLVGHIIWDIIIAIIFAYIIRFTSSHYNYLKGAIYGLVVWFFIKAGATIFKIPIIINVAPTTVTFFLFGSIFYGLIITYVLQLVDRHSTKV